MAVKLRGSRLEAEVDRARADSNWKRLSELLQAMKSKHSGMDDMVELVEAELQLEQFLEQQGEVLRPRRDYANGLREAELLLKETIDRRDGGITLEAHLLLAKLHYATAEYSQALRDIENSGMELANTQFRTLRALRLVAEVYAIKGFCLEALEGNDKAMDKMKSLFCYEKAAELAILYVGEIEKNIVSGTGKGNPSTPSPTQKSEKLGDILECCLERVAALRVRDSAIERKSNVEGIEWYRRIITCLGDKSTGERLQQKMSRQFAELLLRAVPADGRCGTTSQAVSMKSQNLSFYMGSHKGYFAPASRTEEVILLLLISEVLSTREVVLNRSADLSSSRHQSIRTAKSVYNLLTLVLSTLRQYHLLSTVYERAMKFVNQDEYLWQQFALSLVCRGKFLRAVRVLEQCIAAGTKDGHQVNHGNETAEPGSSNNTVMHHMQAAVLHMEHLGQNDAAVSHAAKAVQMCSEGPLEFLKGRAQLLLAIANGRRAQAEPCFDERRRMLKKILTMFENCVNTDPHDYLAHYYCALYHAIVRDLEAARERCARSLELNPEQPSAIMLLALIFTAEGDLKGALELVANAMKDFPTHYGLLVLRLHIETKFGRIDESLDTCTHLLDFWRKRDCYIEDERLQSTLSATDGQSMLKDAASLKAGTPSVGRELSSSTPIFATPLGIGISNPMLNPNAASSQSGLDIAVSVVDSGVPGSEVGGQSTSSESGGAAGSTSAAWSRFRAQANMWMALAELFLAEGRLNDVGPCVEQAVVLFPHAHQALYLKGRLFAARAEKATDEATAVKFRAEANASFLSALAYCPSHTASLFHLAGLYTLEGNDAMAEQMYRELVRVDPLCCEWWQELGSCLMRRGNATKAMECFAAASQLDRSTPLLPFSSIPLVFPSSF
ncbi:unnamed protein product [Cylicocyclus nassatus]|uniref:Tetratricopeptide repeat protein 7 N-terminal domain-containing protein n=1 Tax=Cylicocyclus nassatus TaxID=53992 RepID=A0AA36GY93_CYLNA|nr:unnamed protein product [Cylicocyclus nassatus]